MKRNYTYTKAVALRMIELLDKQKITRYELSKRGDISDSTLQNIIDENTKTCYLESVEKIAYGFGMTLAQFVDSPFFDHDKFND